MVDSATRGTRQDGSGIAFKLVPGGAEGIVMSCKREERIAQRAAAKGVARRDGESWLRCRIESLERRLLMAGGGLDPSVGNSGGALDSSFGNGGRVRLDFFGNGAVAVALQSDGELVIGGEHVGDPHEHMAFARLNADGSFDSSFNGGGTQLVNFSGLAVLSSL